MFEYATDKSVKADNMLYLEHGKPMIFGKDRNKGIRLNGLKPEVVEIGKDCQLDDLLIHDEKAEEPTLAYLLSRMLRCPQVPGSVWACSATSANRPTRNCSTAGSQEVTAKKGKGKIEDLFKAEDVWTVE